PRSRGAPSVEGPGSASHCRGPNLGGGGVRWWARRGGRTKPPPVPGDERRTVSAADADALDQRPVALDVVIAQVLQEPLALTDQQHQTTTSAGVVLVGLKRSEGRG